MREAYSVHIIPLVVFMYVYKLCQLSAYCCYVWCPLCCHSYQTAEKIDSQLKQMAQDLKDIIEQMNSSNTAQEEDSPVSSHAISMCFVA